MSEVPEEIYQHLHGKHISEPFKASFNNAQIQNSRQEFRRDCILQFIEHRDYQYAVDVINECSEFEIFIFGEGDKSE